MKTTADFNDEISHIRSWGGLKTSGKITQIIGLLIESKGPSASLGELCYIYDKFGKKVLCEVVGFKDSHVLLMCLGEMTYISPGSEVYPSGEVHKIPVSRHLCGRVLNGMGEPIDNKGMIRAETYYPVTNSPPDPLKRKRILEPLETGVKAIDSLCTAGKGQRFGIFSGSGVGKSTLLSMIARMSAADVNVIALIGERGREVRDFLERDLGKEGMERSVVIVATSDQPALVRSKGAAIATTIAEYFRDLGHNVVFMMDSITRYAMALREIGLAIGEPPTTKGYTPSVFSSLPRLLERSGNSDKGSITGIYTILMEGDDLNDPVADTVRSILDGHIVLSRKLASANHFPSISVLDSLSRVMKDIVDQDHNRWAGQLRDLLQVYKDAEDLINIGAYAKGNNPKIDQAIAKMDKINDFLRQGVVDSVSFDETLKILKDLVS